MKTKVSELTPEEFQKTFPITLEAPRTEYSDWYEEQKKLILSVVNKEDVVRINHIGSTAIPNIIAKPIVDILLEVDGACKVDDLIETLKTIGFGIEMCNKSENPVRDLLAKGISVEGFGEQVFFLHVRYYGDWNELYFRDYLIAHPDIAIQYSDLKKQIVQDINDGKLERWPDGKPNGYSKAKFVFVDKISADAKKELGDKYKPGR